jgi:hypothetical protein
MTKGFIGELDNVIGASVTPLACLNRQSEKARRPIPNSGFIVHMSFRRCDPIDSHSVVP